MDEFAKRFSAAKKIRSDRVEDDGYEVYKFCFNGREDEWKGKAGRNREPAEIFADMVANVAADFAGELFHTMTPENTPWVKYEAGAAVDEAEVSEVTRLMEERETKIAKAIKASNYYDEGPAAFQDANFGTVAMWVDRMNFGEPIYVEAVPSSEIYIRLGPKGIEDRFRARKYGYQDLPSLFPDAKFPEPIKQAIEKGSGTADVKWGFWRDYSDPKNPLWVKQVRVDNKAVGLDERLEGKGSMPLLVGRFGSEPGKAWGVGPARRNLPTIRVLDELVRMNMEQMDHTLDPAYTYQNDGMLDLSDGIEAGVGYPVMAGSINPVNPILGGQLDYGFFTEERIEERLRDAFYREMIQRGKTPPSASQYVGETQKQIRRMAHPAGKLWNEIGVGLLQRVEWLELQPGGSLQDEEFGAITLDEDQTVTLRPISPLERAQASEDIMMAQSIMEMMAANFGPEQAALLVDGEKTMRNIKDKANDQLLEFRTQEEMMAMMAAQAAQPQGGMPDGGEG